MSALFFLIRRILKNIIKSAFKKPLVLVGYIFLIVFFGAFLVFTLVMPSGLVRKGDPALFRGIMVLVFTFLYYTSLKLGIDKGSSFFRLADVNMVFTAPLKPNKILLYGFIKQLGGTLFLLFFALFQIPNLKNNFEMPYGIAVLLVAVAAYALSVPLIGMTVYSWASVTKERKRLAKRVLDMAALLAAVLFIMDIAKTRNLSASIINVFDSAAARYFPVIGWTGAIASAAVSGFTTPFWVGAAGMITVIAGLSILMYKVNLDYYEDVLEATEFVEAAMKAKREGRKMMFNQKVKANVRQKLSGTGAQAVFAKNMLEIRKTSFFLFLDRISVTVILTPIAFGFIMPAEARLLSLFMILGFSLYMLLLLQVQGRWVSELEKPFIFLVPAAPYEKLFYATLGEHVKNLSDGIILFTLAGFIFKQDIAALVASIITYTLFGAVFIYSDVLTRRIFGSIHSKGMFIFVKVIFLLLLLVPGAIAAGIAIAITESIFIAICALACWALVLAITMFVFSANLFSNVEVAG
jgi:hypothetical protein